MRETALATCDFSDARSAGTSASPGPEGMVNGTLASDTPVAYLSEDS